MLAGWRGGAALALAAALCTGSSCRRAESPPDVILVALDTVRADHLDLYGYPRETAPFLAELARSAVVFDQAFSSSSWTAPATASLFTALDPTRHGVTQGFVATRVAQREVERGGAVALSVSRLPASLPTLPERLRERGYATFGLAANVNVGPELGFDRGFDRFERLPSRTPAAALVARLLEWSEEIRRRRPWLVYLHLNDAHAPYDPRLPWYEPGRSRRESVVAAYDSEIRAADGELRRAFAALDPDAAAIAVVVSDHGEEFWERGRLGHHLSLHGELQRIALIVRAPGVPPRTIHANVGIVDVLPTLLELVDGVPAPHARGSDAAGRSLVPLLRGDDGAERAFDERTLFAHRADFARPDRELWAALRGRYKWIERAEGGLLFDLAEDPGERRPVGAERPAVAAELGAALARHRSGAARPERTEVPLDAPRLEELRALGYVE